MPIQNTAPTDYGTELEGIERRRKMADVLRQQAFQPMETNRTAGGYVVPVSPFEGMAKLLQAHAGNKIDEQSKREKTEVVQGYNQRMADALRKAYGPVDVQPETTDAVGMGENLAGISRTRQPTPQESITALEGSGLPQLQQAALNQRQFLQQKQVEQEMKLDPRYIDAQSKIRAAGRTSVTVNAGDKGMAELSKKDAESVANWRDEAIKASRGLGALKAMKANVQNGVYTGPLAEGQSGLNNFLSSVGAPGVDVKKLSNSQQFMAHNRELALSMLKQYVGGSQISNKDVEIVLSLFPRLEHDPQARLNLINYLEKRANQSINMYQAANEHMRGTGAGTLKGFDPIKYMTEPEPTNRKPLGEIFGGP